MTQLSSALDEKGLALLEAIAPPTQTGNGIDELNTTRIIDAYRVALVKAEQISDPQKMKDRQDMLLRSNVKGSLVPGIRSFEDVVTMLGQSKDWSIVTANLKDQDIICLQGVLPAAYAAWAAYATVREIDKAFGLSGLGTIQWKRGYQNEGEYYNATILRMPTRIITVQLRLGNETTGEPEEVKQWFAGYEVSSILRTDDGDRNVRCGVQLPYAADQPQGHGRRQFVSNSRRS